MARLLLLLVAAVYPVSAAWTAGDVIRVDVTHGNIAQINVLAAQGLGNISLTYGTRNPPTGGNVTPTRAAGKAKSAYFSISPSTVATWYVTVASSSRGAFDCADITLVGDAGCDGSGAIAIPIASVPTTPAPPAYSRMTQSVWSDNCETAGPAVTYKVDDSGSGCAANFDKQMDLAIARWGASESNRDDVVEVRLGCHDPLGAGNDYLFSEMVHDNSARGGIRITSDIDAKLLPPKGVRIDPSWEHNLYRFGYAPSMRLFGEAFDGFNSTTIRFANSSGRNELHHLCFVGLSSGRPQAGEVPVATRTITGASGGNTLTVEPALPAGSHGGMDFIVECDTDTAGSWSGRQSCGMGLDTGDCFEGDTKLILKGPKRPDNSCNSGKIIMAPTGVEITSCTTRGLCVTDGDVQVIDFPEIGIDVITPGAGDSTLILDGSGSAMFARNEAVMVSGSGTSLDGVKLQISAVKSAKEIVVNVEADSTCASDCAGSVREMQMLVIDYSDTPAANKAWYYDKISATSFQLLDPSDWSNQTFTEPVSGGWVAYEPSSSPTYVPWIAPATNNNRNIHFARMIFKPLAFPSMSSGAPFFGGGLGNQSSYDITARDNYFYPKENWSYWDDAFNRWDQYTASRTSNYAGQVFGMTRRRGAKVFVNNAVTGAHGVIVGMDSGINTAGFYPSDAAAEYRGVDFSRNNVVTPEPWLSYTPQWLNAAWTGRAHNTRHCFESKGMGEFRLIGGTCSNIQQDGAGSGAGAIVLKGEGISRATPRNIPIAGDYDLRGFIFYRVPEALMLAQDSSGANPPKPRLLGPVRVAHNWAFLDQFNRQAGRNQTNNDFVGSFIEFVEDGLHDVTVKNNTVALHIPENVDGSLFGYQGGRITRAHYIDNIFQDMGGVRSRLFGFHAATHYCGSATSGDPDLFNCQHKIPDGDGTWSDGLSRFDGNVIISGLADASDSIADINADMVDSSDSANIRDSATIFGGMHTTTPNIFIDTAASSLAERFDECFGVSDWIGFGPCLNKGIDVATLDAMQGHWEISWIGIDATTIRFDLSDVPVMHDDLSTKVECFVDISTDATWTNPDAITRGVDTDKDGRITFSGLARATAYVGRAGCPDAGPVKHIAEFTTP